MDMIKLIKYEIKKLISNKILLVLILLCLLLNILIAYSRAKYELTITLPENEIEVFLIYIKKIKSRLKRII